MSAHSRRDELKSRAVEALRAGHTRKSAAALAGISKDTFYRWLREDSDFSDASTRAEILALADCEQHVFSAAMRGEWRAAAWWLERRDPVNWGRRATISSEGPIEVRVVRVTTEELKAMAAGQ